MTTRATRRFGHGAGRGRVPRLAAVAVVAAAITAAFAPAAGAAVDGPEDCLMNTAPGGVAVWCDPDAPGTQFRATVRCAWSGGPFTIYGTWHTQGGGAWSTALCPSGSISTEYGVQLR